MFLLCCIDQDKWFGFYGETFLSKRYVKVLFPNYSYSEKPV